MPSAQKALALISFITFTTQQILFTNSFTPATSTIDRVDLKAIHNVGQRLIHNFSLQSTASKESADSEAVESEVEKLLRKARELRQEAEAAEEDLHNALIEKKSCHDREVDAAIERLFPTHDARSNLNEDDEVHVHSIVDRLHECQFSTDKLKDVVSRLHEREVAARGLQHVESKKHDQTGHVEFEVVAAPNEAELHKVVGLVDQLIDAAKIVDEDFWKKKRVQGEKLKLHHSDKIHWTTGNLASTLKDRAGFLGREHSEQFKKRMAEYYEAARKKETSKKKSP